MDLLSFLQSVRSRPLIGYAAAIILPIAAIALRTALSGVFVGYPFITYFLAVIIVAIIATKSASAFAAAFSAVLAYRFAEYHGGIAQGNSAWIGLVFFFAVCAIVIVLVDALISALMRLTEAQAQLAATNSELERRVDERTTELQSMNNKLVVETEAKNLAEEQARQLQKMETIGLLTGGIAHDFNNMLSVIGGSLELIQRRVANGSTDITKHIDNAKDGVKRSAALTQRLLAFSRKQPLVPSEINLNALMSTMEELLQRTLGSNIAVRVIKGTDLWSVKADACQLENAILNLAINARDAMPSGGSLIIETKNAQVDNIEAQHGEFRNGQYVLISVTDTGSGMTKDVISRAFEPFFTTKPPGKGTGLGLSQIYGLIRQSNGFVKIDSTVGHGTTVKMYLPQHSKVSNECAENTRRLDH